MIDAENAEPACEHRREWENKEIFDAVVIGTGFAGAVTAARLVEAGLKICVLERGRKYEPNDFPMYPNSESMLDIDGGTAKPGEAPDLARWLWSMDQGLYDVKDLDDVISVQAAGYGGGSLIYANVHLRAPVEVFDQGWPDDYRGGALDRYYDRVAYMLDVQPAPKNWPLRKTRQLEDVATAGVLGAVVEAIDPPLAVNFSKNGIGSEDEKAKPNRFNREQKKCDMRGQCWLGCRQQAKNSLDLNYLVIVEDAPADDEGNVDPQAAPLADIRTLAEVCGIERIKAADENASGACECGARYVVHYRDRLVATTNAARNDEDGKERCVAKRVFLCAGAVNTTELLLRSRETLTAGRQDRAETWWRLGSRYHPNADSIAAVFDCDQPHDADHGPTITSALLHDRPRLTEEDNEDHLLWAIDFKPDCVSPAWATTALRPGVEIGHGDDEARADPSRLNRTILVQPPLFDFGGFVDGSSVAMLVVKGGTDIKQLEGQTLYAEWSTNIWQAFGRLLGKPRQLEDWFLIEDGGYPTDIEPVLGIMRSPLWLRRNRFLEPREEAPKVFAGDGAVAPRSSRPTEAVGPMRFPLATALESVVGTPRTSARISTSLDGLTPGDALLSSAQPMQMSLEKMLPPWLLDALAKDRDQLARAMATMIGPMLDAVLDDVAKRMVGRFDVDNIAGSFSDSVSGVIGDVPDDEKEVLIRGLLRQGIQVLWGSEVALAERINSIVMSNLPGDTRALTRLLAPLVGWLLQYREGDGHSALLLIMGRDQYRGRLRIDHEKGHLTAFLPKPVAPTSRATQERVLRDIARHWGGELRTNPAWTSLQRRVTVHSQGGCPMNAEGSIAVTEPSGELRGCEGLYVMDAAAFPTAVGVNPSATIAAVAEYKVEKFIKDVLGLEPNACRPSATDEKVATWIRDTKALHGEDVFDPLAAAKPVSSEGPRSAPLGLTFVEELSGLFAGPLQTGGQPVEHDPVDWRGLVGFDGRRGAFDQAERRGIDDNLLVKMKLTAVVDDLDKFLRVQRQGGSEAMRLEGTITISRDEGRVHDGLAHDSHGIEDGVYDVDPASSDLRFFVTPEDQEDGRRSRYFRYSILTKKTAGRKIRIEGAKVVRDDTRFDVWQDLATLYVDIFADDSREKPPALRGIMRLTPVNFFERQLRSITITPDGVKGTDPTRRSWAYYAFIRYFAGELAAIYLKRPGMIKDMFKNLLDPTHGV